MNTRTRHDLDGVWQFAFTDTITPTPPADAAWRAAVVPMPWQAQFDDLRHAAGVGWYERTLPLDAAPAGAAILHFGAVDYHATVWVNGTQVGEHEGGYLPFEFDVAAHLHAGDNTIRVRAIDANDDRETFPDFPFSEVPHGKQSWYGPIGGIWQSVWLEERHPVHLRSLRLTPDAATGAIDIAADVAGAPDRIEVRVADPDGRNVAEGVLDGGRGAVTVEDVQLWSPETPALYTVTATLLVNGAPVDELAAACGFRTVEARDGRIYLNGAPIYLRGVLDQAYYPGTIYTPPSLEYLEEQARTAKDLGLNCLRAHIKIEDPRYYEVADRLGLLVWTEIPNWVHLSEAADARIKATFQAMVARDWNHPSIIAWSLVNENWGTDLARDPAHRAWLADFVDEARRIDPTRLIVDNSACRGNLHVAGDLEDFHEYRAIPDHAAEWDAWVDDFAGRARWAWAEDYDHTRRADLPLILSEFGNWGLPDPAAIQEQGAEPWWFENGHNFGDGIVYPHGVEARFVAAGLDRLYPSLADFARAHQVHMAKSLHYEITSMRRADAIGGYVITEFTDVHWECNGLLDMQRHVKAGLAEIFTPINQDDVLALRPLAWSGAPGAQVAVEVHTFGVDGLATDGVVRWRCGGATGELAAPGGRVDVTLPQTSGLHPFHATWLGHDGRTLATSQVDLTVAQPDWPDTPVRVADDPALAQVLAELGLEVTDDAEAPIIARAYTPTLRDAVQQGARLALLLDAGATQGMALPWGAVVPRAGTPWQGDWATSFAWLRKEGPFAALPGDPLLEMDFAPVMPEAVLVGIPHWATDASWAGLAVGWIHKPVSLLAAGPYGRGQIAVTTFRLDADLVAGNVVAQSLLAGLVRKII